MATIEHLSADATTDAIVEVLERDGAVIIDGLMASDEVARLNDDQRRFYPKKFTDVTSSPAIKRSVLAHSLRALKPARTLP